MIIVVVIDCIYMNQTPSINIHLYTTQYTQTAELVNVALDIFLGRIFSAPGMYFIYNNFCNLICPQISHFHCF